MSGTLIATVYLVINPTDFFTIYFACGAPFAVYYFLQNRHLDPTVSFWFKNALVFLFWMLFAVVLLTQKQNRAGLLDLKIFNFAFVRDSNTEKLALLQKQLENVLLKSDLEVSIFDFRETAERYAGLTVAAKSEGDSGREIFRAAKSDRIELGTICLQRRNRNKLTRHQAAARQDFLKIVGRLSDSVSDTGTVQYPAFEIVKILGDDEARNNLEKMFTADLQIGKPLSVKYSDKDLWKPQERQSLHAETVSTRS